jgi:uncharacterized protein YdeI (YjbR/CyaY-like superfamily)
MKPLFFPSQSDFRNWLKKNHKKATELLVGFYKVDSGKPSMTWSQSVDQALCFGWIDGVRRSIDEESYSIRFTPRRKTSIWSAVNIRKVEELTKQGLMQPAGVEALRHRKAEKSGIYSFENQPKTLPRNYEKKFRSNKNAWLFFTEQAPSYRRVMFFYILSAKQESTRLKRLEKVIAESGKQRRVT